VNTFLQLVVSGIGAGSAFSLVGIGMVLIYRTTGIINFAQGQFAVMAGLVTASLANHMPVIVAGLIGVAVSVAIGVVVGFVAPGREGTTPLASIVVTIGLAFVASAAALAIFGDTAHTYNAVGGKAWDVAGILIQPQYVLIFATAGVFSLALGPLIGRTMLGHALVACSDSQRAAKLIGLNVRSLAVASFALAALLAAVGGILLTPLVPARFDSDVALAVNAFVAAVFGGLVSVRGAFFGGLVLGVAESLVSGYVSGQYDLTIALVLMLVIMVARTGSRRAVTA